MRGSREPGDAERTGADGETEPTDAELEAEREALLELLDGTEPDDAEAAARAAAVGASSCVLHARRRTPEDLALADRFFSLAFRTPGDGPRWHAWRIRYGHVLGFRYDEEADAALLDQALDLIREGLSGLPDGSEYDVERGLGLHLLALLSLSRVVGLPDGYDEEARAALIDASVAHHRAALPLFAPDSEEAVGLHASLGFLFLQRAAGTGGGQGGAAEQSVRHYGRVLDAALPTSDLPYVRYSRAIGLMIHGASALDRTRLEEAREEFDAAVQDATRAGERPAWAWEAGIRSAFVRATLWSGWRDPAQAAVAETTLHGLLGEPGATDPLMPQYLDVFGRVLYERAALRGDTAAQDRAIDLMRRAVTEWEPRRDGTVTRAAFFLALAQQTRYFGDPDPRRLRDVADAAVLILDDESLPPPALRTARLIGGWAWIKLGEHGIRPPSPEDLPKGMWGADLDAEAAALFDDMERGDIHPEFGDGDAGFPGFLGGRMSLLGDALDFAYAFWSGLEPGPDKDLGALVLLGQLPGADPHSDRVDRARRAALVACVLEAESDDPTWGMRVHTTLARLRLSEETEASGRTADEAVDHVDLARAAGGATGGRLSERLDLLGILAENHRGQTRGVTDDQERAAATWQRIRESPTVTPYVRSLMEAQQAALAVPAAVRRGDLAGADRYLAVVADTYASLHDDDPTRIELWTAVEKLRLGRDALADRLGVPPYRPMAAGPTTAELRRDARRLPRDRRIAVLGGNGIARYGRAALAEDAAGVEDALGLVREAYELADEGSESRVRYAASLGTGLCGLAQTRSDAVSRARDLAEGIALLEAAFRGTGGPTSRLYATMGAILASAYRLRGDALRGDRENSRRTGLDALRGHAWAALQQSGTDHAMVAALDATSTALEVGAWCLSDGALDEAVQALDSCRGLVLHAAVTSRQVPERLAAAGHADLAEEWRHAGMGAEPETDLLSATGFTATGSTGTGSTATGSTGSVPSSLRRRVLAALRSSGDGQDRLLEPPVVDEIAAALRSLRKDALVYLVPASEDIGGTALVVTDRGSTHVVPLPRLTEDATALRDYLPAAHQARDPGAEAGGADGGGDEPRDLGPVTGGPVGGGDDATMRRRLDRLCGWAWYAAIRPLLDAFGEPPVAGRVPRLVLVPMGGLGLVPWHAAWEQNADGGRQYAVEKAEISYAASARLLCEVASRDATAHDGAALLVGDPTGDLRYAGEEADAVHRAFYPAGRYLGRRRDGVVGSAVDGAGTPEEVVTWLAEGAGGGRVLHLACHASIARDIDRTSYLSLYGGELAAEEITEAVGSRGGIGLVLLAACRSHVSGRGHNEAYSLATAFLVAGARSVVGSLWPVPDDSTSVLMFMTHHFLRVEGEPPARALRRAQLWMLDPDRLAPDTLPPHLSERARRLDPADLRSWAGFTHLGQ
ncbi:CHAT domain-containing protein [Streptomyces sp. NPDC050842]|uniref:CHAT domain-containing protein n=1 Tax=Streptomyces sp. NPDC050842 TaxID=3365636 RepID=UPI0037972531